MDVWASGCLQLLPFRQRDSCDARLPFPIRLSRVFATSRDHIGPILSDLLRHKYFREVDPRVDLRRVGTHKHIKHVTGVGVRDYLAILSSTGDKFCADVIAVPYGRHSWWGHWRFGRPRLDGRTALMVQAARYARKFQRS